MSVEQGFRVRLPVVAGFDPGGGMRAHGVMAALQRMDLGDPEAVGSHVKEYGAGLLREVVLGLLHQRDDPRTLDFVDQWYSIPRDKLVQFISRHWAENDTEISLAKRHLLEIHEASRWIESSLKAIRRGQVKVGVLGRFHMVLAMEPAESSPHVVLGDLDRLAGPNEPQARLDPYSRMRFEAMLAMSQDGPGLARCAYCERYFVQVRGGERYARFCPGYECGQRFKKQTYERSPYRREYRRRQLALSRLRLKSGASAAEIREAEAEFETWKRTAKESNR